MKSQLEHLNKIKLEWRYTRKTFGSITEIFTESFTQKFKCKAFPMPLSFCSVAAIPEQMPALTNVVQQEFFQFYIIRYNVLMISYEK